MTSTSTPRTRLNRLLNSLAALALLLMVAGGASAQRTIFVDATNGVDTRNGTSATVNANGTGPVATLDRAIALAAAETAAGSTISIAAGTYDATVAIAGDDQLDNLTFQARASGTSTAVILNTNGGTFSTEAEGFAFTSTGGGRFIFSGSGTTDFDDGSVNFGSGIVSYGSTVANLNATFTGNVERTDATVSGSVQYVSVPSAITFNGTGDIMAGSLLPGTLDIASGSVTVNVNLTPATGSTIAVLSTQGLTLGDGGGAVTLNVAANNRIDGAIRTIAGNGTGAADVSIDGEGSVGDLTVDGAVTRFSIDRATGAMDASANAATSIAVISGTLDFDGTDDRYVVGDNFTQTGGTVTASGVGNQTILVVKGDFTRAQNQAFPSINIYLEGTDDATFSPGPALVLNSVHVNATPDAVGNSKSVTFANGVLLNSANAIPAFIVTNDAEVDLNGNLVTIQNGGESIVEGTVSDATDDGAIRFANGGIARGEGTYSTIIVDGGDVTVPTGADFDFTGALSLIGGGINIADGASVSPTGDDPSITVSIDTPTASITTTGTGTFNSADTAYSLLYIGGSGAAFTTFTAGSEFDTDNLQDLEVDITNAQIDVPATVAGGTIGGNVIVRSGDSGSGTDGAILNFQGDQDIVVAGFTRVERNAAIALQDATTTYAVSTANNVLGGVLTGSLTTPGVSGTLILQDGATITGDPTLDANGAPTATGSAAATDDSIIEANISLASGATASLLRLRTITGDITDAAAAAEDAGSLTIGLVADNNPTGQDGAPNFTQDTNGNIDGTVTLDFSTLVMASGLQFTQSGSTIEIATLDTGSFVFFTETVQAGPNVDNNDGPSALILTNDVQGTGTVWPSSNLTISASGMAPQTITIPVFHPGDDDTDVITVATNVDVTRTLRITGTLDAQSADVVGPPAVDYAVTLDAGADSLVVNLILDEGYAITGDPNAGGDELVINGAVDLTSSEVGTFDPYTELVLDSGDVRTFALNGGAPIQLADNDASYEVVNFLPNAGTTLDLNSNDLSVSGNASLITDGGLFNSQGAAAGSRLVNGTVNPAYSTFSFVGEGNSTLTVTPNQTSGVATFGNGVDLRIAKDTTSATVTLMGGSLVFDDEFGGDAADFDDETLILESGVLVVDGDNYIRLDHSNSITATSTSDNGQGFVFIPMDTQFPMSWIDGNVRKRIISVPSSDATTRRNPGRVIYPVGAADSTSEGYAEYVLDFESITQSQSFGQRSVTVSFENEAPQGNLGLPIDSDGQSIGDTAGFYWLVNSNPNLGAGTFFNVEARYDGFELATDTNDGSAATVDELVLLQRQFGNASQNPYTLAGDSFANFLVEDGDDNNPVVVAQNVEALLGGQGTIFTYGLSRGNQATPVEPGTALPTVLALKGNAPNPFRGRTMVSFDLPEASEVTLTVFDVMGRQVMNLDAGTMTPGTNQTIEIDGSALASGVYVYRLTAVGADNQPATLAGQITLAR